MIYIRYLRSIILGFLIGFFIFLLAVFYQIGTPTESSRWISEIYKIKSEIAQKIQTPKIVVVSGSNALFGISCQLISQETAIPCVNGGTHAGLGIDYILYRAHNWIKSGDIVILPLEYEAYTEDDYPTSLLIDYILSRDNQYLSSSDLITKFRLITGVSLERVFLGIETKINRKSKSWKSFYKSENLNNYGDETSNLIVNMKEKQFKAVAKLQPVPVVSEIKSSKGMAKITEFVQWCQKNQIKVIATWPNTVWFDIYQKTRVNEFKNIEEFYQKINVPILGKPKDFMYNKSMFYDTSYHLNDRGVRQRTQQLINLLKPYLQTWKTKAN